MTMHLEATLSSDHLADLKKSGLEDNTIARLAFSAVVPSRLNKLGAKCQAVTSAYEIPYWNLDGTMNGFERFKLFPTIKDKAGHSVKYFQRPGTEPHLYFPPISAWPLIASDPSEIIYFTEGEKKSAAGNQAGLPTIGVGGVWSWRVKLDSGKRLVCPELDQCVWKNRQVEVIPDSDGWRPGKLFDVLAGFYALGMELIQRGARVQFIKFPEAYGITAGLDDWLVKEGNLWQYGWDKLERVPLDDKRLHKLAGWWQDWEKRQHEPTVHLPKIYHLTDYGNAERMVARYGKDLRYCHVWGKWLHWNGCRWQLDEIEEVTRLAKATVRQIFSEAAQLEDQEERKKLATHAFKSESHSRVQAMIRMAESEENSTVTPDQLDNHPWLLNCPNGVVDLRTGELLPHQREFLMTKIVSVDYTPDAPAPRWESFLYRIMHERQDLVDFLQRAVGYGLTGETIEQILFLLYGIGANGKTTFLETLRALLGEYAHHTDFSTFVVKNNDPVRNDLARLVGTRLVTAIESEEGRRFSEVVVKQLTGGDTLTARFLYREFFEFKPTFKLFLATNHKPVIKGTDHAIWRRIRLVPFTVTIPDEEQDKALNDKLREELPGILAWAVRGCLAWQKQGLGAPEEVLNATQDYKNEMDTLGSFLEECCVQEAYAHVTSKALYQAYEQWCEANGEDPMSQRALGLRLQERGFVKERTSHFRGWQGLGLLQGDTQ